MADPVAAALRAGLDRLVRANLRGVWLRGTLPAGPFVWAANHHSWWDPFVAASVLRRAGRTPGLVMDQDNLARFPFARRLGVFGAREPRTGLRHLADGRVLIIFPEGELRPAGHVTPLAQGAAWYAVRADAPLMAIAVRVAVRGHQAPEAYASAVGVPVDDDVAKTTRRLGDELRHELSTLDEQLAAADPRTPLDGFQRVLRGKRSWDERLSRRSQ